MGLGAPYWDEYARGLLIGITSRTTKAHIIRAALESIAYLTKDVLEEMDKLVSIKEIKVDGGAARNDFLMKFQADITGKKVVRGKVLESTSLGAAFLAGLKGKVWNDLKEIREIWGLDAEFLPTMAEEERDKLCSGWKEAVKRCLGWAKVVE